MFASWCKNALCSYGSLCNSHKHSACPTGLQVAPTGRCRICTACTISKASSLTGTPPMVLCVVPGRIASCGACAIPVVLFWLPWPGMEKFTTCSVPAVISLAFPPGCSQLLQPAMEHEMLVLFPRLAKDRIPLLRSPSGLLAVVLCIGAELVLFL